MICSAINALKTDALIEVIYIEQSLDSEAWALPEARLDKEWSLVDTSSEDSEDESQKPWFNEINR